MTQSSGLILCPYHGVRQAVDGGVCAACRAGDEAIAAMTPFEPLGPMIETARYPAAGTRVSAVTFSMAPAQSLLATERTGLVTVDELLPQIPLRIGELERAMAAAGVAPIGPLVLMYDHPDVADFEHFRFAAGYPVSSGGVMPADLVRCELAAQEVASIEFVGPWSMLHLAYPPLRRAIEEAGLAFGPLTFERYVVPRGTNAGDNVTIVQRQVVRHV